MPHRINEPEIMIRYGVREPDTLDPLFYMVRIVNAGLRPGHLQMSAPAIFLLMITLVMCAFSLLQPLVHLLIVIFAPQAVANSWLYAVGAGQFLFLATMTLQHGLQFRKKTSFTAKVFNSDIAISDSGIRLLNRSHNRLIEVRRMDWQSLTGVYLVERALSKLRPHEKTLCLVLRDRRKREMVMAINAIRSIEERRLLVEIIKDKARLVLNDTDLSSIVRVSQMNELTFTRLWSQALADRTPRVCSTILSPDWRLQDGRFLVHKQIGAGGQGSVYTAEMLDIPEQPQRVVLKEYVLPDYNHELDRHRAIEQFEREVSILSKLNSPQIVRLIDAFVEDHRAYLVLDFVEGVSLRDLVVRGGALPAAKVADLAKQLCDALEYLHNLSPPMVHMDFTPENLMLKPDNKLLVIDFSTASNVSLSPTSIVIGKQSYMAPEQYRGTVQPSCDIFALGCSLYYLLTAEEPEALTKLQIPKTLAVSPSLARIITKATELEAGLRYQNASELRLDIEDYLAQSAHDVSNRKESGVC